MSDVIISDVAQKRSELIGFCEARRKTASRKLDKLTRDSAEYKRITLDVNAWGRLGNRALVCKVMDSTDTEEGLNNLEKAINQKAGIVNFYVPNKIESADDGPTDDGRGHGLWTLENLTNAKGFKDWEAVGPWLAWRKKLTLVYANPKAGKTTLAASDASHAVDAGYKILWITADEDRDDILFRFSKFQISDKSMMDIKLKDSVTDWDDICEAVRISQPDIIYFDTLVKMCSNALHSDLDQSDAIKWDALMDQFRNLGKDINAGVVVIHHKNRRGTLHGSQGIKSGVDMLVDFIEDKKTDQPHIEYDGRRSIRSDLASEKNYRQFQYTENERLVEIVPQYKMNQAEIFLHTYLQSNGPTLSHKIINDAKKQSISQSSIYTAFRSLNIITKGKGKEWELPADTQKPTKDKLITEDTDY